MTNRACPTADSIECRPSEPSKHLRTPKTESRVDFSPCSTTPDDTKPQLIDFENLIVTNDLANLTAAIHTPEWPEDDDTQLQHLLHLPMSMDDTTLNTPELVDALATPLWPRACAPRRSPSPPCNVFDERHEDHDDALNLDRPNNAYDNQFEEMLNVDDPMLTFTNEAVAFLPATTVASVLVDMETPAYEVVDVQPHSSPRRALIDHDYCEVDDDEEGGVLDEFLDMTAGFEGGVERSINLAPFIFNVDDDATSERSAVSSARGDYGKRRAANNLACQRSRKKRRMNRTQLMAEFARLSERNVELVDEVAHLEMMRDEWKERLLNLVDN